MATYSFSIFTPTFNRAHCLHDVFDSLMKQTFKDFEWIIVDDGSEDNTKNLINEFKSESNFPIYYMYQENMGKHVAQNRALDISQGELFLPLDSDDTVLPDGLEKLWNAWMSIPQNERPLFSGIGCHCVDGGVLE